MKGWIVLRDRGGDAWDIVASGADATPFVAEAARAMGGIDVHVRALAREIPGVIDYVTGWWDDARGSVRLTREPAGALGEIRVLVCEAQGWCVGGGESARVFDVWERDEDRGAVDVAELLRELREAVAIEIERSVAFEEIVDWLTCAHDDGAHVRFARTL